ncbi:MAG: XdhC/CoxI family protein, partial [Thermodesulfobacteriota bacterium]
LEDGSLRGTIGGGRMEFLLIEKAKEMIPKKESAILKLSLTGSDVLKSEMLCGGRVEIFLEPLSSEHPGVREIFSKIVETVKSGKRCRFLSEVAEGIRANEGGFRAVIDENGSITGTLSGLDIERLTPFLKTDSPQLLKIKGLERNIFVETIRPADTVYIFGGGHISKFLSPLAVLIGFRVVVIDDRPEFADPERFPEADEVVVSSFSESFRSLQILPSSYVVIVTRGHIHDREVLRMALEKKPGYIGMIGSTRKRDKIYSSLKKEGFSKEMLDAVHCPVGLMINALTPEEIAVSIVAQLIEVKNRKSWGGAIHDLKGE